MQIQGGYFEHYFGKEPTFNIMFQQKPILAQKSPYPSPPTPISSHIFFILFLFFILFSFFPHFLPQLFSYSLSSLTYTQPTPHFSPIFYFILIFLFLPFSSPTFLILSLFLYPHTTKPPFFFLNFSPTLSKTPLTTTSTFFSPILTRFFPFLCVLPQCPTIPSSHSFHSSFPHFFFTPQTTSTDSPFYFIFIFATQTPHPGGTPRILF